MPQKSTRLVVVSAMVLAIILVGTSPRSSLADAAQDSYLSFVFYGSQTGNFSATGRLTSFTEPVKFKTLYWSYSYQFRCSVPVRDLAPPTGTEFACKDDSARNINGEYQLKYLVGASGSNCISPIIERPGASWGAMATLISEDRHRVLRVVASPPPNGPVLYAIDPCGYPPAVDWQGNINLVGITKNLVDLFAGLRAGSGYGCQTVTNSVTGDMSGWSGGSTSRSFVRICPVKGPRFPDPPSLMDNWNRLVEQWLQDRLNDVQLGLPPEPAPYLDSQFTGQYAGSVYLEDPTLLTTFTQPLVADTSTQLAATLSDAQLAQIAKLTSPPTVRVSSTFTPEHGRPVKTTSTYRLSLLSTATSVTFEGSPTDPTITVHGQDFGTLPKPDPPILEATNGCPAAPGTYGSDYGTDLYLSALTANWGAGQYNPGTEVDCIGIIPTSRSSTEITFHLGSFYTDNPNKFSLTQGLPVQLDVDGAAINVHVVYGSTVTS